MRKALATSAALIVLGIATPVNAGGAYCTEGFSDKRGTTVNMKDYCFDPTVIRIEPGETVTWTNKDSVMHNVAGVSNVFGDVYSGGVAAGDKISYRFEEEGTYPYLCILHPGMAGAVVVGDGEGDVDATAAALIAPTKKEGDGAEAGLAAASETDADSMLGWITVVVTALTLGASGLVAIAIRRGRRSRSFQPS